MAQTSGPRRTLVDRFRIFSFPDEPEPALLENFKSQWDVYMEDSSSIRFPRRIAMIKYHESNSPTKTPENQKLWTIVPNAPLKSRKTIRKPDLRPRKLDYTEPEVDDENFVDSSAGSNSTRSQILSRNDELPGRGKNPEGKSRQISQNKSKKKLLNCDKENDSSLVNRMEQRLSLTARQTNILKNRSKLISSQNISKLEGDFAHFRI